MNKIEEKAYVVYPDCDYPCDKPSIFEDGRVTRELRNAYVRGSEDMLCRAKEWVGENFVYLRNGGFDSSEDAVRCFYKAMKWGDE